MISAAQIRGARAMLNISQTELAERANLSQNTVHRIEKGEDGNMSTIKAIEAVFEKAGFHFRSDYFEHGEMVLFVPMTAHAKSNVRQKANKQPSKKVKPVATKRKDKR
jgi:predicted transcriptional regulator